MQIKDLKDLEEKPLRELVKGQRYTEDQWAEIEAAAKKAGMAPGKFVRACALTQAREINSKRKGK